jgi:hypothetical protein
MKVKVKEYYDNTSVLRPQVSLVIKIDDKQVFCVNELCDSPEDATFDRDLSDCNRIPELLRIAYVAGYNRDFFEIEYIEEEE